MSTHPTLSISAKLEKRLANYMAAAGTAGIGAFLAVPQVQGKIVYTPTNTVIDGLVGVDVNHDGVTDFTFGFHILDKDVVLGVTSPVVGNGVMLKGGAAVAGVFGMPVGPGEHFGATASGYSWVFMADAGSYSVTWFFGPWANAVNRYLGFRFKINGETHYGWARLTVGDYLHNSQAVALTGYAYETEANKPVAEGHLSDGTATLVSPNALMPSSQPAGLGLLARGAEGLVIWRREGDASLQAN